MSTRAIIASKNMVQNGASVSQAMRDAGYSESSARKQSLTKTKVYKDIVLPKLKKANVTVDTYIHNVGVAMNANEKVQRGTKVTTVGKGKDKITTSVPLYEEIENIPLRLQGNKQAEKLLKIDQLVGVSSDDAGSSDLSSEDLTALLNESDEVVITQALFRKSK